ncbi:MAG: nucleotidyltransferase domain-containing protein [Gemmatimonadetes bacterium]|nr:nucleotidyltransferase domain-containing protein [Gemmatimonadota bacterium]
MGTRPAIRRSRVGAALFSDVQGRVLALLFGQPARRFQGAELLRLVGSGTGATHRVLHQLVDAELVTVVPVGNQRHYQANAQSPVFEDLCRLVLKTVAVAEPLQKALAPLASRIAEAFVFGSVAAGVERASSDLDLFIVSDDVEYAELFDRLASAERELGRRIEPTLLTTQAFARRLRTTDGFAKRVASGDRIPIIARTS